MRVDLFDFELPPELIAQAPIRPRDAARLLLVDDGPLREALVRELPDLLRPGDLLVLNDTRVLPTRFFARRGGVAVEVTLVQRIDEAAWWALARPGKRLRPGDTVDLAPNLAATVAGKDQEGRVRLDFSHAGEPLLDAIRARGAMPLPPYIRRPRGGDTRDAADYQSVFARRDGAVAAPTASLHLTEGLLARLDEAGIARCFVTLHVGAGTFAPVKSEDTAGHVMHAEWCEVPAATAEAIASARARGGRIVAVGTTSLRTLESRAEPDGTVLPGCGRHAPVRDAGLPVPCGRPAPHQLPPAAQHAVHAGRRLLRPRADQGRLRARDRGALPLFQLRRRLPADPRWADGMIGFDLLAQDGAARRGRLNTAFGTVETPAFMPVGTAATVKAMTVDMLAATGAEIVLCNTYHLMLRPGADRVARLGGLHRFMRWDGPILTNSGGYQVMSLAERRKLTEHGVVFSSHHDGSRHELTPERSVEIQHLLDATITMVLDECIALPAAEAEVARAMELSLRWAERSKAAFVPREGYGLFGIVQGGTDPAQRARSARGLVEIGFDGYAVGGLAVGEPQDLMLATLDVTCPLLPTDRPRYLMGVGKPADLVAAVARGVDMFDCVLPTRSGRTAQAFTRRGTVNLKNARHADDPRPLDEESACPAARDYSRAYLHHLVRSGEILGAMLLTWNNLWYYQDLMRDLRAAIEKRRLADFAAAFHDEQARGDLPPWP